jgi:hypothetical protein
VARVDDGLAGRDPIFHAQLESEKRCWPSQTGFLDNTCYRCHGVMGQRQVELTSMNHFDIAWFTHCRTTRSDLSKGDAKYGALARDGISCDVCHRIAKEDLGKPSTFTGLFKVDPRRRQRTIR